MAKKKKKENKDVLDTGNTLLSEITTHYDIAQDENNVRRTHKTQGFDTYDQLFRSYITKSKWPYNARIFDPRAFGAIYKKTTRLISSKMRGRLVARDVDNELGARVGSELLSFQWDEIGMHSDEPMLSRVAKVDMSTRKYGGGFAYVPWRTERDKNGKAIYDGPWYENLNARDVLTQPGRPSIEKSDWVIVRRYTTLDELKNVNDTAVMEPIYGSDALEELKKLKGNMGNHYNSINREVKGLSTKVEGEERIEVCTEYRRDKWITWVPLRGGKSDKKGLILREIDNPYDHGQIPIVRLVYYPIDDDIYGVSELEPIAALQKALNALVSQTFDTINVDLYPIIKVTNPTGAIMPSFQFKARAKWLMNTGTTVERLESGTSSLSKFREMATYLIQAINEALGETGQGVSSMAAFQNDKTATEIKDMAMLRNARDNFNKLFLKAHLAKVMQFWWSMDKQFLSKTKVIRIAGKEAIEYFLDKELDGWTLSDEGKEIVGEYMNEAGLSFDEAYEELRQQGALEEYATPIYPVEISGESVPKLRMGDDGKTGYLAFDKEKDTVGEFDFIPDVESMSLPNDKDLLQTRLMYYKLILESQQQLAEEGVKPKYKELLVSLGERAKIDDADQYFEDKGMEAQAQGMPNPEGMVPQPNVLGGVPPQAQGAPVPSQPQPRV